MGSWDETLLKDEKGKTCVQIPIFVRDIDEYGEKFYPEICGGSIYRNLKFPLKLPFCERLSFLLQTSRLPIPVTSADVSIFSKNSVLSVNLQNLSLLKSPPEVEP